MKYSRCKAMMFSALTNLNKIKDDDQLPEKVRYKLKMAYNYVDQCIDDIQDQVTNELRGLLSQDETNEILNRHARDANEY